MDRVTLFSAAFGDIALLDHPREHLHGRSEAIWGNAHTINILMQGEFFVRDKNGHLHFEPDDILVTSPETKPLESRLRSHLDSIWLSVRLLPDSFEEALGFRNAAKDPIRISACDMSVFHRFRIEQALQTREDFSIESAMLGMLPLFRQDAIVERRIFNSRRLAHYLKHMQGAVEYMESNFNHPCTLSGLSRAIGMSPFHFSRIFKSCVGMSPCQYLIMVRLAHAERLLREGDSVTGAASKSGFDNLSYFIRMFNKRFGKTPGTHKALMTQRSLSACG